MEKQGVIREDVTPRVVKCLVTGCMGDVGGLKAADFDKKASDADRIKELEQDPVGRLSQDVAEADQP